MNLSGSYLSKLELHTSDPEQVIQALVNENGKNRSERRQIARAFGKVKNRDAYYEKQRARENENLRDQYQKMLDARIDNAEHVVHDGLVDNWTKMMALMALVLKRKYNWNDGRIGSFIEKANELHKNLVASGEWADIEKLVEDECSIELEVSDD